VGSGSRKEVCRVACPTSATLTTLAEVKVKNMLMRVSTSLWVVLRGCQQAPVLGGQQLGTH
jgi:hypothetical protein